VIEKNVASEEIFLKNKSRMMQKLIGQIRNKFLKLISIEYYFTAVSWDLYSDQTKKKMYTFIT